MAEVLARIYVTPIKGRAKDAVITDLPTIEAKFNCPSAVLNAPFKRPQLPFQSCTKLSFNIP